MKKSLTLFLTVFLAMHVYSQPDNDSLTAVANSFSNDAAGVKKTLDLAGSFKNADLDTYFAMNKIAAEKAAAIKNDTLLCIAYLNLGMASNEMSESAAASAYLTKAKWLAEKANHPVLLMRITGTTGTTYYINKQYPKALEFYVKSLELARNISDKRSQITAMGNIAAVYYDLGQQDTTKLDYAMHYARQAFSLAKQLRDTNQLINQSCNLALMLSDLHKTDSAGQFLRYAKTMIADDDYANLTTYYSNLGRVNWEEKNYAAAIMHYEKTIEAAEKYNSPEWIFESYLMISEIYEEQQKTADALNYYRKYVLLKDSVISKENFAKAADIQNKYEREKKEKEIIQLNKEKEIAAVKKNRLIILLLCAFAGLLLLSILAGKLQLSIKAKKKALSDLEKSNEDIRIQALELSRQARLIAKFQSQMNPHFTFNALHNIYGLVITNENEKAVQQIQSLAGLMRQTLTNSIKEEITLDEEIKYLQKYIDFEKATAPVNFDFTIEVDRDLEDALIPPMMIQPFIENAVKHAELEKASNPFVKVLIEKENDLLKLIIEDNGRGFNKTAGNTNKLSHSISIIKSRIEILLKEVDNNIAGNLSIRTPPGKTSGTIVEFYLPLNFAH